MQARYGKNARARSLVMRALVRSWEYRNPQVLASVRSVVGGGVILLGVILCGVGCWWGALVMAVGALTIVVAGLMFALVTTPGVTRPASVDLSA
jgi:hypothetical protein